MRHRSTVRSLGFRAVLTGLPTYVQSSRESYCRLRLPQVPSQSEPIGLTRRCSGLATLAAELHIVRLLAGRVGPVSRISNQLGPGEGTGTRPLRRAVGSPILMAADRALAVRNNGALLGGHTFRLASPTSELSLLFAFTSATTSEPPFKSRRHSEDFGLRACGFRVPFQRPSLWPSRGSSPSHFARLQQCILAAR